MTKPQLVATRTCPHCYETILQSAAVCPACRHRLRFDGPSSDTVAITSGALTPLRVEGSFRNPAGGGAQEYSVVVTIRNEHGEEIARRMVGIGAMREGEQRTFTLDVEMSPVDNKRTRH